MTGDSYYPITLYGYKVRDAEIHSKEIMSIIEGISSVELHYCIEFAYSRWETLHPLDIFVSHLNSYNKSYAILGISITNGNVFELLNIKLFLESIFPKIKDYVDIELGLYTMVTLGTGVLSED
jgi:hypothetical protein